MKYIDAEKLYAKVDALMAHYAKVEKEVEDDTELSIFYQGKRKMCSEIINLINSLQQEQISLPDNLDEAAEEYAYNNWEDNDYHTGASEGLPFDAIGHTEKCFKAGAEWMAGQMKQEQPEVDLEKEIDNMIEDLEGCAISENGELKAHLIPIEQLRDFARHFAQWQKKQIEVDLEKYIENEINHYGLSLYEASYGTFSASQIDRIIRNAFELGLKAKKQ